MDVFKNEDDFKTGMWNPKLIFKTTCASREFSILQYRTKSGPRYVVGETGVEIMFTFTNIKEAYEMLMQRMHIRYSLNEVEHKLKDKEAAK